VWDGCIAEFIVGLAVLHAATQAFVATQQSVASRNSWAPDAPPARIPYGGGNPEIQDHGHDATGETEEVKGVVDRAGSKERHKDAMKGTKPIPGKDRDPFPPAVIKSDATATSVRPTSQGQNRSAGAALGNAIRGLPDGTPIILVVPPTSK
jgi:hypothetical protein